MDNINNELSLLRLAHLNGSDIALFEALNRCMDNIPYDVDLTETGQKIEIPTWMLQVFRELIVARMKTKKGHKPGAKPDHRIKALAARAKELAKLDKENDPTIKLHERAQEHLISLGEGLQPETIKLYAREFDREDKKLDGLGKYLLLDEEGQKIFDEVVQCMNWH